MIIPETLTLAEMLEIVNAAVSTFLDSPEGDPAIAADNLREIADEVCGE